MKAFLLPPLRFPGQMDSVKAASVLVLELIGQQGAPLLSSSSLPPLSSSSLPLLFSSFPPPLFSSSLPLLFSSFLPPPFFFSLPPLFSSSPPLLFSSSPPLPSFFSPPLPSFFSPPPLSSQHPGSYPQTSSLLPARSSDAFPPGSEFQFRASLPSLHPQDAAKDTSGRTSTEAPSSA